MKTLSLKSKFGSVLTFSIEDGELVTKKTQTYNGLTVRSIYTADQAVALRNFLDDHIVDAPTLR